jgi:hypothetical protein
MERTTHRRERKLVPRFRRSHANTSNVDIDDEEAQALINQELSSVYNWTSDTTATLKEYQVDHDTNEQGETRLSVIDENGASCAFDIDGHEHSNVRWKLSVLDNDESSAGLLDDDQQMCVSLSIESIADREQRWSLDKHKEQHEHVHGLDSDEAICQHDLHPSPRHDRLTFVHGDDFPSQVNTVGARASPLSMRDTSLQRGFAVHGDEHQFNLFPDETDEHAKVAFDSSASPTVCLLSLPQSAVQEVFPSGTSDYRLSLLADTLTQQFSASTSAQWQLDSAHSAFLSWSLELL